MIDKLADPVWLTATEICSIDDLTALSGMSRDEIGALIDSGVIAVRGDAEYSGQFGLDCVFTVIKARRLHDDFELDWHGTALALTLMRRIEELETQLTAARSRDQATQHLEIES